MRRSFFLSLLVLLAFCLPGPLFADARLDQELLQRVAAGRATDVAILLKNGANPNVADALGWPALSIAAARADEQSLPIVRALLEAGANPDAPGIGNNYPLIRAAQSGNAKVVKLLLEQGANYDIQDSLGISLEQIAEDSGDEAVNALIAAARASDTRVLVESRSQENLDRLVQGIAFHACARQYFSFYYKTGADPIPEHEQEATLKKHRDLISEYLTELSRWFRVPQEDIEPGYTKSAHLVNYELEQLISNRNRRKHGVGQPGDMEERCNRLTAEYHSGYLSIGSTQRRRAR